ncbi:IS3 family transposase [Pseudomonas asuensis]
MAKYSLQFKLMVVRDYLESADGFSRVSHRHQVERSLVRAWVAAFQQHGEAGLIPTRSHYTTAFKLAVLKRLYEEGLSYRQAAALFNIANKSSVMHWQQAYERGGLPALTRKRRGAEVKERNASVIETLNGSNDAQRTQQELTNEVVRLQLENAYLKKARSLGSTPTTLSTREKTQIVIALRQHYPLACLLKSAGLARSTFYYQSNALAAADKYAGLKSTIKTLFERHKGRYGYRRITAAIRNQGTGINHKTIQRLMGILALKSSIRRRSKYRAYRGSTSRAAPNRLNRDFSAERPNERWVTDITEFNLGGPKLYLSPVLDLYNREIITYEMARRPVFDMVRDMMGKAFKRLRRNEAPLLHSDQGWHYQMPAFGRLLERRGLTQSMSRRGNCLDNAAMESFFAVLKSELYYREAFNSVAGLEKALRGYIRYYNHDRLKLSLGGLSPIQFRLKESGVSSSSRATAQR